MEEFLGRESLSFGELFRAFAIASSGWILMAAYLLYEFLALGSLTGMVEHLFLEHHPAEAFFHSLIFLYPLATTAYAYSGVISESRGQGQQALIDIIETTPDFVAIASPDGEVLYYNSAAKEMLGIERLRDTDEVEISETHDEASAKTVEQQGIPTAIEEGYWEGETVLKSTTGEEIPVSQVIIAHRDDSGLRLLSTIARDIREKKRREEQLDVLDRVLRHDLRSGMNLIEGHTQNIIEECEGEGIEADAESVIEEGNRLLRTSQKAHRLREAFRETERRRPMDPASVVEEVVSQAEEQFPRAEVSTDYEEGLEVIATSHLFDALLELVENAVIHSPSENPEIEISVTPYDGGSSVDIAVRDSGPGIPEEEIKPLREGEESALIHSTGIGLWMVKWYSELQGGELLFREEQDKFVPVVRLLSAAINEPGSGGQT